MFVACGGNVYCVVAFDVFVADSSFVCCLLPLFVGVGCMVFGVFSALLLLDFVRWSLRVAV